MLRAAQVVVDEGLAKPILIGRPEVIDARAERLGLRLARRASDYELINPASDPRYNDYVAFYLERAGRKGVTPQTARETLRTRRDGDRGRDAGARRGRRHAGRPGRPASRPICATSPTSSGCGRRCSEASAVHALVLDAGALFIADTSVSYDPDAGADRRDRDPGRDAGARLRHRAQGGAGQPLQFRQPRHALGAQDARGAGDPARRRAPALEVDGEMQVDTALDAGDPRPAAPGSTLKGAANLLIMPSLDAASAAYNLLKAVTGAVTIGPMLIGPRLPAHIVNRSVTSRGIVNMSAVACRRGRSASPEAPVDERERDAARAR